MPIRHATLHQLKIFDALVRHMSVTRAAEALHLTPPAVSIQVKQLAEAAGQPLVEQVGKKLHLTTAGEAVAHACRDILDRMERLSQELTGLKGLEQGRLSLAILTGAKYFAPRFLGDFCARHPGIDASLFVGNREVLLERIKHNQDDLYILGQPPQNARVVAKAFADNPLVLVAHPGHPLAAERAIAPSRLKNFPFILREPGSGTRLAMMDFFKRRGVTLKVRMELGSNEAIKQSVMAGLGVAVLSQHNLGLELAGGHIVSLDVTGFPLKRKWYVMYPEGKKLSKAARVFLDFLLDQGAEYRPAPGA